MSAVSQASYCSPHEVAIMLGVSIKTVRRAYASGRINSYKFGRRVLLQVEEVEAALRRTIRHFQPVGPQHGSALDAAGQAIRFAPAEAHQRARLALSTLDALATAETSSADDQSASWADLVAHLQRNREGADLAPTG